MDILNKENSPEWSKFVQSAMVRSAMWGVRRERAFDREICSTTHCGTAVGFLKTGQLAVMDENSIRQVTASESFQFIMQVFSEDIRNQDDQALKEWSDIICEILNGRRDG